MQRHSHNPGDRALWPDASGQPALLLSSSVNQRTGEYNQEPSGANLLRAFFVASVLFNRCPMLRS
jgi:hypothetical protein